MKILIKKEPGDIAWSVYYWDSFLDMWYFHKICFTKFGAKLAMKRYKKKMEKRKTQKVKEYEYEI